MRLLKIELTNFLSYHSATLELDDLVALVGPNASGKSNAIAAIKLLRDIPAVGLPTAIAKRGGFDQLRHRSEGRPYDPAIAIELELEPGLRPTRYELKLGSIAGKRYYVKSERASIFMHDSESNFSHQKGQLTGRRRVRPNPDAPWTNMRPFDPQPVPEGHSALQLAFNYASFAIWEALRDIQIVEVNPSIVRTFQEPSSGYDLEPDGSNTASFFDDLSKQNRARLVDALATIVPGICDIEPKRFSNRLTIAFYQRVNGQKREFLANQMSDGTLRAFAILLALLQDDTPSVLIVEEPEVAIHLGALRSLVEILQAYADDVQIVFTTHSADIIDLLDVSSLRVIWTEKGASRLSRVASHTRDTVRSGLITPGDLLRTNALDPAPA